jgi:hypothetical protein
LFLCGLKAQTIHDLDAVIFLQDWLCRYPGTLLLISHDRLGLGCPKQAFAKIATRRKV